jgi:hypothetical protein
MRDKNKSKTSFVYINIELKLDLRNSLLIYLSLINFYNIGNNNKRFRRDPVMNDNFFKDIDKHLPQLKHL